MKHEILLVGEDSLLKFKLSSVLSRRRQVHLCDDLQEAERFLSETQVRYIVLCDLYDNDLCHGADLWKDSRLICLTSIHTVDSNCRMPGTDGVLQIFYDQIYGFSGYSASGASAMQILYTGEKQVAPTLVDDIAFWLSEHLDSEGLYYLRGPLAMTNEAFAHMVTTEQVPAYLPEEDCAAGNWPGTVVLLRHTPEQGIDIIRHQQSCAVNLIYKLPLHTPVAGSTVQAVRERLGTFAGLRIPEELRARLDYICPIPNSGIPYARAAAAAAGLPLVNAVEKLTKERSFLVEDASLRSNLIARTMRIDREKVRGASICLVDEAIFTGMTVKLLSAMLRAYGAKEIHVLIPTPPCTAKCQYCSIPTRDMLLETIPREQLEETLGVDSVIFQTKEVMASVIQETRMTCCDCFS